MVGLCFCVSMHHLHCTWSLFPLTFLWGLLHRSVVDEHNCCECLAVLLCIQSLVQSTQLLLDLS
jgi:hypothetical protein